MNTPDVDLRMLNLAARLAIRGFGRVEPGAMVGAVIARSEVILGMGHHRRVGGAHAEAAALEDCRRRGHDPRGATVYCTLEPCNAQGRNPPCVEALIRAGVSRVVYARRDPNPKKGGGHAALAAAGIRVEQSNLSPAAVYVGAPFVKRITTGLPWTIAKWAQTLDGRVATRTGDSKWISGEASRFRVHRLRSRVDAILTGIGTVIADDPLLTARLDRRSAKAPPLRVVLDPSLRTPIDCRLVRTAREVPTLVVAASASLDRPETLDSKRKLEQAGVTVAAAAADGRGLQLRPVLAMLGEQRGVSNLLIEAGPRLLGGLFGADLVDQAIVYVAPLLLGDELARSAVVGREAAHLSESMRLQLLRSKVVGGDVELTYVRAVS